MDILNDNTIDKLSNEKDTFIIFLSEIIHSCSEHNLDLFS